MFRSVSEFIQSTQFIGQPGKPIQSAIKYHSFLYIALNEDNKPKIGFSIGDRILGKEYTFVWSWSLPKPIAIESKIKQQLNPFAIKSETIEFDDLKYKTETFNIDVLTLIHIVRINILALSAEMQYIPFGKKMQQLYEKINRRDFNLIKCLQEEYIAYNLEDVEYDDLKEFDFVYDNNEIKRKNQLGEGQYTKLKASNYLNVDDLYAFINVDLKKLNIQTTSQIFPVETMVNVEPLRMEGDFYVVEYNGNAMYVDKNVLTKQQIKNLNTHLPKNTTKSKKELSGLQERVLKMLEKNARYKSLEKYQQERIQKELSQSEEMALDIGDNIDEFLSLFYPKKPITFDWVFSGPRFKNSIDWWLSRQKNVNGENIKTFIKGKNKDGTKRKPSCTQLIEKVDQKKDVYVRVLWIMENNQPNWYYALVVDMDNDSNVILWNGELKEDNQLDTWQQNLDIDTWYVPTTEEMDVMQFVNRPTRDLYEKVKDRDLNRDEFEELKQNQVFSVDEVIKQQEWDELKKKIKYLKYKN